MLKISSFYPFKNMLRVTHEFGDNEVYVYTKSLKMEHEFEFDYKDVTEISDSFQGNTDQMSFGFWLLLFSAFIMVIFCRPIYANPILLLLGRILFLSGIFLYFTGFKKDWWFYFSDSNSNTISWIKQTAKNRSKIFQALDLIKRKSDKVVEISASNPFPEYKEMFEHKYYDYSNLVEFTDRFYENEIVGFQKGVSQESVYRIKYSQLTGKTHHAKLRVEIWGWTLTIVTLITGIFGGFYFAFGIPMGMTILPNYLYLIYGMYGIFILSIPFNLIKREVIGLLDKNGNVVYWAFINKTDKEKFEKIIAFIKSKVPAGLPEHR